MQLRPFLTHTEINDIQVNQTELYLDADTTENSNIFDETLPPLPDNESDKELEAETDKINSGNDTPTFSVVMA